MNNCQDLLDINTNKDMSYEYPTSVFTSREYTFEILSEEDEEIDIDSIEEFEFGEIEDRSHYETRYKINKLIKAVKQLNKR